MKNSCKNLSRQRVNEKKLKKIPLAVGLINKYLKKWKKYLKKNPCHKSVNEKIVFKIL